MRSKSCLLILLAAMLLLSSCSIINEHMSDCGLDNSIVYEMQVVTKVQTELQTQLNTQYEIPVAEALASNLTNIFTDKAHDIDLSFYNTKNIREKHEQHTMDASSAQYVLYLPEHDYRHLAVANIKDAHNVSLLSSDTNPLDMRLLQQTADTIDSHNTGLFTARKILELCDCTEEYNVDLYMANSCTALVVDTAGVDVKGMKMFAKDFATDFAVSDSAYHFDSNPVVRSVEMEVPKEIHRACHYVVSFPSRDEALQLSSQKRATPTNAPTKATPDAYYRVMAYITLPDGSITENIISVESPLLAGRLKIIKLEMKPNGSLTPVSQDVGVSVTLDWKEGGTYEPEI